MVVIFSFLKMQGSQIHFKCPMCQVLKHNCIGFHGATRNKRGPTHFIQIANGGNAFLKCTIGTRGFGQPCKIQSLIGPQEVHTQTYKSLFEIVISFSNFLHIDVTKRHHLNCTNKTILTTQTGYNVTLVPSFCFLLSMTCRNGDPVFLHSRQSLTSSGTEQTLETPLFGCPILSLYKQTTINYKLPRTVCITVPFTFSQKMSLQRGDICMTLDTHLACKHHAPISQAHERKASLQELPTQR